MMLIIAKVVKVIRLDDYGFIYRFLINVALHYAYIY